MWLVIRAPFLPIGSLAIWTRISWPSLSKSLILGTSCGSCRLNAHLGTGIYCAVAASLGIKQSLCLRLRLFQFQFLGVVLALSRAGFRRRNAARLDRA